MARINLLPWREEQRRDRPECHHGDPFGPIPVTPRTAPSEEMGAESYDYSEARTKIPVVHQQKGFLGQYYFIDGCEYVGASLTNHFI